MYAQFRIRQILVKGNISNSLIENKRTIKMIGMDFMSFNPSEQRKKIIITTRGDDIVLE
jgi:hypothetical protein